MFFLRMEGRFARYVWIGGIAKKPGCDALGSWDLQGRRENLETGVSKSERRVINEICWQIDNTYLNQRSLRL